MEFWSISVTAKYLNSNICVFTFTKHGVAQAIAGATQELRFDSQKRQNAFLVFKKSTMAQGLTQRVYGFLPPVVQLREREADHSDPCQD